MAGKKFAMSNRADEDKIRRCKHAKRSYRITSFIKRNGGLIAIAIGWAFLFACGSIDAAPNELTPNQRTAGELGLVGICALFFGCGYMARGDGDD